MAAENLVDFGAGWISGAVSIVLTQVSGGWLGSRRYERQTQLGETSLPPWFLIASTNFSWVSHPNAELISVVEEKRRTLISRLIFKLAAHFRNRVSLQRRLASWSDVLYTPDPSGCPDRTDASSHTSQATVQHWKPESSEQDFESSRLAKTGLATTAVVYCCLPRHRQDVCVT